MYTANKQVDGAVILRSEPATGSTVEISRNGPLGTLFHQPYDLAVEADGGIVVADMGVPNQKDGSVIRVDPVTGRQSLVSSGAGTSTTRPGSRSAPAACSTCSTTCAGPNSGAVIKVDPNTGAQQLIASNFTLDPTSCSTSRSASRWKPDGPDHRRQPLAHGGAPVPCLLGTGRVFAVNPGTSSESLSRSRTAVYPLGVAIDTDGSLVVANECGGASANGFVRVTADRLQEHITTNNTEDVLRTPERVGDRPGRRPAGHRLLVGADSDGGIVKVNPATGESGAHHRQPLQPPARDRGRPDSPPTAALTIAPKTVAAGRQVTLDASGSRDPEGLRLVYEWDLDGNGTFEAGSGTTPTAMPKFSGDGIKTVRIRVDDPHGGRAVAVGTLDVDGSRPALTSLRTLAHVLGVPGRARVPSPPGPPARSRRAPRRQLPALRGRHRDARGEPRAQRSPAQGEDLQRACQARAPAPPGRAPHDQAVPARGSNGITCARSRPQAGPLPAGADGGRRGRQPFAAPRPRAAGRAAAALEPRRWRDRGRARSGCRLPRRAGSRWPRRASPTAARPGPGGTPCGAC